MLNGSTLSKRSARRKAGVEAKVTFKTFTSSNRPHDVGERAVALHATEVRSRTLPSRRARVGIFVLGLAVALLGASYATFESLELSNKQIGPPSLRADSAKSPCSLALSGTSIESRMKSVFGGVSVETGEVDCGGEFFIVTQTSNADGKVLSVRKKRA